MENDFFLTRDFAEFFFFFFYIQYDNRGWQFAKEAYNFEMIVILNLRSLWDLFVSMKFTTIRWILYIYVKCTIIEKLFDWAFKDWRKRSEKYHRTIIKNRLMQVVERDRSNDVISRAGSRQMDWIEEEERSIHIPSASSIYTHLSPCHRATA